ncbi:MAG: hypothetical protein H6R12_1926 [Proteobacteria bacterium]|nr:hypothetical protein [Pseudomonadota bacterium]
MRASPKPAGKTAPPAGMGMMLADRRGRIEPAHRRRGGAAPGARQRSGHGAQPREINRCSRRRCRRGPPAHRGRSCRRVPTPAASVRPRRAVRGPTACAAVSGAKKTTAANKTRRPDLNDSVSFIALLLTVGELGQDDASGCQRRPPVSWSVAHAPRLHPCLMHGDGAQRRRETRGSAVCRAALRSSVQSSLPPHGSVAGRTMLSWSDVVRI